MTGDELSPDELQLRFHEVECATYDARFGIVAEPAAAADAAREADRLLGDGPLGRVLDVGCGTGYLGLGLAVAGRCERPLLCDLSPGMLGRARDSAQRLGVEVDLVQASAARLPLPDASIDTVVTRGVLHHLHDVDAALREWRRVLRPGGRLLLLSEPTPLADRVGGAVARATQHGLVGVRSVARRLGRPLPTHDPQVAAEHEFWDLVAMAANLHVFRATELGEALRAAGFADVVVRGAGAVSIAALSAWYVTVGAVPGLADDRAAVRAAGAIWRVLRRIDELLVEPLLADDRCLTVQGVATAR